MVQHTKPVLLASLLLGIMSAPAHAAEREPVRIVVNLVAAVKMPYPGICTRNRARAQRAWLELNGATVACLRLERSAGGATSLLHQSAPVRKCCGIRNEPAAGIEVRDLYYYVDDSRISTA